jgi:hypothetical protein
MAEEGRDAPEIEEFLFYMDNLAPRITELHATRVFENVTVCTDNKYWILLGYFSREQLI